MTTRRSVSLVAAAALLPSILGCGSSDSNSTIDDAAVVFDAADVCTAPKTAEELIGCVNPTNLSADIAEIAQERVPGSSHWQSVQDLCRSRLESYGFAVELQNYGTGVNVIGRLAGTVSNSSEVVVSAHYDHIAGCPGAGDNAAGLAATLEVARLLSSRDNSHPLVIACWDEEERGLIGSKAYADAARAAEQNIGFVISFDTIGFLSTEPNSQTLPPGFDILFPTESAEIAANDSRGDFVSIISDEASALLVASFVAHADSIGLKRSSLVVPQNLLLVPATGDLRRSDHASFWVNNFPGIILSDTANFRNPNYHCLNGTDSPDTLNMEFVTQITQAAVASAADVLDAP